MILKFSLILLAVALLAAACSGEQGASASPTVAAPPEPKPPKPLELGGDSAAVRDAIRRPGEISNTRSSQTHANSITSPPVNAKPKPAPRSSFSVRRFRSRK